MTWIVAKQFLPGYVALFSDIQVTWNSGKLRRDCLKKVYPVANNIIAGFSGSVDIGFALLHDLNTYIAEIDEYGNNLLPRKIAHGWYRRAKKRFTQLPKIQQKAGCSIILAGVSAMEIVNNSDLPRSDIVIFRHSNGFKPMFVPFLKTASIGSGNNVKSYREFLDDTNNMGNFVNLSKADARVGGAGEQLAFQASIMLQDKQVAGISPHVHCSLVYKDSWSQFPLNFTTHSGDEITEFIMPKVTESYNEFKKLEQIISAIAGAGSA